MSVLYILLSCCILLIKYNEAARILAVLPVPSISHQVVFRPLTQALAKRGHKVVVITTDPVFSQETAPANLTEIDVHDISYKIWKDTFMITSKGNQDDLIFQWKIVLETMITLVDAQLSNVQVQKMLNNENEKFDLIISEACVRSALIFSHIYKAPTIQMSSFGAVFDNYATVGAASHPFLYPEVTYHKLNNLSTLEKIRQLYNNYLIDNIYESLKESEYKMLRKYFGDKTPSIDTLNSNVHMLYLNIHPIFQGIRPVPPSVVYISGLHQKPQKDLPPDLQSYLDSSKNGVIYISFGTNVDPSLLPAERIQTFVQVFSKLPYNVLWKWNNDELPGRTDNIKISKWLPQFDLLRHKNIKLFITQGGLQSTDEAIIAAVPLIGIPMLGDQWFNVEKYEYHKIGIRLDMDSLTEDKLTKAIINVIEDKSYRRNIEKLGELMRDEPMRPLEKAVWWTEYVLRHGGALHLRSPAANISWAQYLELELLFTILAFTVLIIIFCVTILLYIYKYVVKNYIIAKIKRA